MNLNNCNNFKDFRELARRRLPRPIFDYIDGAADDELTYARNTDSFNSVSLIPNVLRSVKDIDMSTTIFGKKISMPVYCSPTAVQRLFHYQGERAVAAAANKFDTMFGVSSLSTVSVDEISSISECPKMFQFYFHKDRGLNKYMLDRAKKAKFDVLALTVDTITGGNRERDLKTGFTIPPKLNFNSMLSFAIKPSWLFNFLTSPAFELPHLQNHVDEGTSAVTSIGSYFSNMLDQSMSWKDAEKLRSDWNGPFALKGIVSVVKVVLGLFLLYKLGMAALTMVGALRTAGIIGQTKAQMTNNGVMTAANSITLRGLAAMKRIVPIMLAFGAAALMIGGGIGIAALGLAQLVKAFSGLGDAAWPATVAIIGFTVAFGLLMLGLVALVAGPQAAATAAAVGVLIAVGQAALMIGGGMALAAFGMGYFLNSLNPSKLVKLSEASGSMFDLAKGLSALAVAFALLGTPWAVAGLTAFTLSVIGLSAAFSMLAFAIKPLLKPLVDITANLAAVAAADMESVAKGFENVKTAIEKIPKDKSIALKATMDSATGLAHARALTMAMTTATEDAAVRNIVYAPGTAQPLAGPRVAQTQHERPYDVTIKLELDGEKVGEKVIRIVGGKAKEATFGTA